MRMLARAAASAALLAAMATFCAADEYAPLPNLAPKPIPASPGKPVFTEAKLLNGAGRAVNGLQLTVTADQFTLPETLGPVGQPLVITPTTLHLLFKNVSEQPLVLDAYNLSLTRLDMIVVGPEKQTVAFTRKAAGFRSRAALPIDYPQLEPGNVFVPMTAVNPVQFPGDFNLLFSYGLYVPGEYKVQVIYTRPAAGAPELGVWQGRVVSNTLTFRIQGPMPPPPPEKGTPATTSEPPPPPKPPPPSADAPQ